MMKLHYNYCNVINASEANGIFTEVLSRICGAVIIMKQRSKRIIEIFRVSFHSNFIGNPAALTYFTRFTASAYETTSHSPSEAKMINSSSSLIV